MGAQLLFAAQELATPFVELQVAAVEGSITVIEAFLKASKLGATGLYPRFGFIFELEGCFLGGELGLASGVLGRTLGILDDGARVGASLSLARRRPEFVIEVTYDDA